MPKLNKEQRNYIESLESKKDRKKMKKLMKKSNKEVELVNSIKVLRKFFKTISPE